MYTKYITSLVFLFTLTSGFTQSDHQYVYRKERLLMPFISTNGYGVSYSFFRKKTVANYKFFKIGLSELKHSKEIKGVNSNYYGGGQFVFGKKNHIYPLALDMGLSRKVVLKNSRRSVGIRYNYSIGADIAFLKPAYYEIELVYSQDSSITVIDKFNPNYHDINNVVRRVSWFHGLNEVKFNPGVHFEIGFMVDFSRRINRIHGVGVSSQIHLWLLPVKIIATESKEYFHFGFRLYYIWGKIIEDIKGKNSSKQYVGWGMLKKH